MQKHATATLLLLVATLVPACGSAPTLTMSSTKELVYQEVRSPELAKKSYSMAMLVPPLTTEVGRNTDITATAEAAMLKSGMRAVSAAHAAGFRAAAKGIDSPEGAELVEKAIANLKESGAEVVVVLSHMEWSTDERPTRMFIGDGSSAFREVDTAEFGPWTGPKFAFTSPVLSFAGKVVDVASTETLATFEAQAPANWNLPADYVATMAQDGEKWTIQSQSFDYNAKQWLPAAQKATEGRVVQYAVSLVVPTAGGDAPESADNADPAAKSPESESSNPKQ